MLRGVSSVSFNRNNINFTMARYTQAGLQKAGECADIYEPFGSPNEYMGVNEAFYKKTGIFNNPLKKYIKHEIPKRKTPKPENLQQVKDTIVEYGTTPYAYLNSLFIKQVLKSGKYIKKLDESTQAELAGSVARVLENNWNNPLISKKETEELASMAQGALGTGAYYSIVGSIRNCDIKD